MHLSIGVDIGGTFTDVVALDETGAYVVSKVPSTPANPAIGFWKGIDTIVEMTGTSTNEIARLVHGTTIATNAILEHKGAKIGILTTKGFQDTLIVGRFRRSVLYSVFFDPETPTFLCERRQIMPITERMGPSGDVLIPLDETEVREAVDYLVQYHGVQSIAVCYLFSFANAVHEKRTEEIIHEHYPNLRVSLSFTINPRFREYERTVITAFDAYVGPVIGRYIDRIENELHRRQIGIKLQVMQSRGGITSAEMSREKPVLTLLSGPAAGIAGAAFIGGLAGRKNLITLDMGGTSNDVALIQDGKPFLSIEGKIGKYPLRQAMVDISTIGAGGGSIASFDPACGISVGPQSAGADPGPACYGKGGDEPTVTDASVVLGYLNPEYLAGGGLRLQPELARKAIQERIATPLGIDVSQAAAGIHTIVNNNMANNVRLVSVNKGHHPKHFSLVAFGGAGPVAAGRLMQLLGLKEIIIPPIPGVLCALGLLVANLEHEEVGNLMAKATEVDPEDIRQVLHRTEEVCEQKREGVGISLTELHVDYTAEMRYVGQAYELSVPFPEGKGEISKHGIQEVVKRFHSIHQRIYQHSAPDSPVEFVALRTVFSQKPQLLPIMRKPRIVPSGKVVPKEWRQAYFDEYHGLVDTPIYERTAIGLGQKITGAAIVEQPDTTTVIYPNQIAEADEWGNLIITSV